MINDAHCHFFSSRFLELLAPDAGGADALAARLEWDPPRHADRARRSLGRASSIATASSRAALIASIPGDAVSVAEAVAHHPHRFVGFFMHNPVAGLDSDAALERALKELNMRAVCLFPAMHGYRLDDEAVEQVFKAAANHGAAVFVHCGVLTVGVRKKLGLPSRFDLRLGDPLALARVAARIPPGAGHRPALRRRVLPRGADGRRPVPDDPLRHVELQQLDPLPERPTLEAVFSSALAVVGASRLLFGTDSSFFPRGWQKGIYEEQQRAMIGAGIGADDRKAIFERQLRSLVPCVTS